MTMEQLQLVHRRHRRQAPAVDRGHGRGQPRRRRRPRDPRDARSRPGCRRSASPPAQVNQALRQVNIDAAGGAAEIAGSRQSVRVLGNADTACELSPDPRSALGGGRTIKLDRDRHGLRRLFGEQTSIAKINGRQVVTFGIERAKGASDVTVYDAAIEELKRDRGGEPGHQLHPAVHQRRLHQGPVRELDGGDGRGRDPRGHRGVPVPARLARDDRSRRWRSRCRRSRPSGSWTCWASR